MWKQFVTCVHFSLFQEVNCDTQVELWLNAFIAATKEALKFQVATATGLEKPPSRMREIHSAGARKVKVAERSAKGRRTPQLGMNTD